MKIYIGQIYIEPKVFYPFSHLFQIWLGEELTKRLKPSKEFIINYGEDFDLIFRVSAKSRISEVEIKGPTIFKRDKDIEFTVFLPFSDSNTNGVVKYRQVLTRLFNGIVNALQSLGIDASNVINDSAELIEYFYSAPEMISTR